MSEDVVSIVKWVNRTKIALTYCYYGETADGISMVTSKLSEAKIYDTKYFCRKLDKFEPHAITKKELFEARLANK